jgi:hypothetical protein
VIALSIRQPWAWAILYAGKDVENRSWALPAHMVGKRILLHASKTCSRAEYEDASDTIEIVHGFRVPPLAELDRGAVVGAFTLVGCFGPSEVGGGQWHIQGQFGLSIAKVSVLPSPVSCKGALGFFSVPPDVAKAIREQVSGFPTAVRR